MRRRHWLCLAVLVAASAGLVLPLFGGKSSAPARAARVATAESTSATPVMRPASAAPAPRPRGALHGSAVDGAVHLDAQGRPVADRALRRMFDYFLIRTGEQSPAQIRDALRQHLAARLEPDAVAQVLAWFDAYLALLQESATLGASGDPRADLERRRELRIRRLGRALAQAWFGQEEAALADALARQRARREAQSTGVPSSSAVLPADIEDLDARAAMDVQALIESRQWDAATRARVRERMWGASAARRLAALDARRAHWRLRLQTYARARDRVLDDPHLDDSQRRQALERLLEPFDANERLRVDVLARHGKLP